MSEEELKTATQYVEEQKELEYLKLQNKILIRERKDLIKYLEDMLDRPNDIFSVVRVKDVLDKIKENK